MEEAPPREGPQLVRDGSDLTVRIGDRPVLTYNLGAYLPAGLPEHYRRSGFIHPVYSPLGRVVTDGFPVGYAHQHGIFTAWTKTTFRGEAVDFWNAQSGSGKIGHEELVETQRQDGFTGFRTRLLHRSRIHDSLPVLEEYLTLRVHDRRDVFVWDLRSEQRNITGDTLYLERHLYGGLGVRGSKHWNPTDSLHYTGPAKFLTSEGLGRDSANHTRPLWTALYGNLPRGEAGLACIPHPENPRWPQPVRAHPNLPYFSISPIVFSPTLIAPNQKIIARYRFVTFDGPPPRELLDELAWGKAE